jgi:sugar phosphate permease
MIRSTKAIPVKLTKARRLAWFRSIAVSILSVAGVVNYLDRGSLAVANTTIRADLGISATQMGVLLSTFSLAYAVSQLPAGFLLDRFGERIILGTAMFLWSATQTATGLVRGFSSFIVMRICLAMGEAPFVVSAVKAVNEWFDDRNRATPMGIINSATTMGQSLAPPILTVIMLAFGWRRMFMLIGLPGILLSIVWFVFYRERKDHARDDEEEVHAEHPEASRLRSTISASDWIGLFRQRTVWGLMLGFGGINYTVWLYMSWMPNYLEAEHHLTVAATGWIAIIPFTCGAIGMMLSGIIADFLVRNGATPVQSHRSLLIIGMISSGICTLSVPHISSAIGAAFGMGMALFFTYLAGNSGWGLVQAITPPRIVASVATIQNFGSFVLASFAPFITGYLFDRVHSFHLTLVICSMVSIIGALSYLIVVKDSITLGSSELPYGT